MRLDHAVHITPVARPFDITLRQFRQALNRAGLSVVEQVDLTDGPERNHRARASDCALLMVDCPLLLLEAMALERSAAVFLPLHIVISGDQHSTTIQWMHPARCAGMQMPLTARRAMDELCARVSLVLASADSW